MIKFLFVLFAIIAGYSVMFSYYGITLLTAIVSAALYTFDRMLTEGHERWMKDPENSYMVEDTKQMLCKYDCECSSAYTDPRCPNQNTKSDLEK